MSTFFFLYSVFLWQLLPSFWRLIIVSLFNFFVSNWIICFFSSRLSTWKWLTLSLLCHEPALEEKFDFLSFFFAHILNIFCCEIIPWIKPLGSLKRFCSFQQKKHIDIFPYFWAANRQRRILVGRKSLSFLFLLLSNFFFLQGHLGCNQSNHCKSLHFFFLGIMFFFSCPVRGTWLWFITER